MTSTCSHDQNNDNMNITHNYLTHKTSMWTILRNLSDPAIISMLTKEILMEILMEQAIGGGLRFRKICPV